MKKTVSLILSLCMTLVLTACGGQAPVSTAPKGSLAEASGNSSAQQTKLAIWLAGTGDPVYDNTYRKVFDAYVAENPNASYEMTFIPWSEYFTKLNTALAGGAGPDLFMLGYGQMGTVQSMDYLLPLDEYIPADWDGWTDFMPNILEVCKKDGVMYGMFEPSTRVYFYRKDIAAQNGVTAEELVVKSYEDLVHLAEKMTVRDEKGNILMSGLNIVTSQNSPEQQFLVNMSYVTDQAALWDTQYQPLFNSADGVTGMQNLVDMLGSGVSLPSDPNDLSPPVVSGIASMALSAENGYQQADDAFPGQIGIVECHLGSLLIGNYMAVNQATKNKDESVKMLLHMHSQESGRTFAEGMGQFSGRFSLNEEYIALNPEEYSKIVLAYEKSVPLGASMNPYYNKMITIFRTAIEEIYAGADPQSRLDQAAEEYIAAMQEA